MGLAQTGPSITRVIHNGTGTLMTGDTLNVVILGSPGCRARFEILGAIRSVPLTEVQSGRYETRYTIPPGLQVERGIVIGYLSRNGYESVLEASQPVTIKMGQGSQTPSNTSKITTSPEDNETIDEVRPEIEAEFPIALQPQQVRFYVDGIDFSRQVKLEDGSKTVVWTPGYDLTKAKHQVDITAIDITGQLTKHSWSFEIGEARGRRRGFVSEYLPGEDATISEMRPTIGAKFRRPMSNLKLIIDNRDFTSLAKISDTEISWTPTYDLSSGTHTVKVVGYNHRGRERSQDWSFKLDPTGGNTITSVTFSPQTVRVGQVVTVNVQAPSGSNLNFDVGNRKQFIPLTENGRTGQFSGQYTAAAGDEGQHNILARLKMSNGLTTTKAATGVITIQSAGLTVDNLRDGMGVPVNFNVQGSADYGAQVTVVTEYAKNDFLGALSGQTERKTYSAVVGANKRFDIPVQMGTRKGQSFRLTVSDNRGSQNLVFNLVRQ